MVVVYSVGLRMYKCSFGSLSRIGSTRQEAIRALVIAYNQDITNRG